MTTHAKQVEDVDRSKHTFYLSVHHIQHSGNALSGLFSKLDQHFIANHNDRRDLMRMYKDIPLSLDQLYTDSDYVRRQHGHDVQV